MANAYVHLSRAVSSVQFVFYMIVVEKMSVQI